MSVLFKASILVLLLSSFAFTQEPVPILEAHWEHTVLRAPKQQVEGYGPATPVMNETKNFQRRAREQRTDNPLDPNEASIEGRSRALDKQVRESRTPNLEDQKGYAYTVEVRNDTGQAVMVVYWEYQFTEKARPTNIVRRQFLCGVKIKDREKKVLTAFSILGPSDAIDVQSLAKPSDKLFDEKVRVNRIELADGNILQRNDWKFSDVKKSVERVTSAPWGNELCRAL